MILDLLHGQAGKIKKETAFKNSLFYIVAGSRIELETSGL